MIRRDGGIVVQLLRFLPPSCADGASTVIVCRMSSFNPYGRPALFALHTLAGGLLLLLRPARR
jgi:hypothetical protein